MITYHFHSPILFLENVNAASTKRSPEIFKSSQKLVFSLTVTTPQTDIMDETLNNDLTKRPFVIISRRGIVKVPSGMPIGTNWFNFYLFQYKWTSFGKEHKVRLKFCNPKNHNHDRNCSNLLRYLFLFYFVISTFITPLRY